MNNNIFYTILPLQLIYDEEYKALSSKSILLYSLILNRLRLSSANEKFKDEKGMFIHYSTPQICEHLRCGRSTAKGVIQELESAGLVKIESGQLGLPLKIYVNDVFGIHNRTYGQGASQSKPQDKPKPKYTGNLQSPAVEKKPSFDMDKIDEMKRNHLLTFSQKNKKRKPD